MQNNHDLAQLYISYCVKVEAFYLPEACLFEQNNLGINFYSERNGRLICCLFRSRQYRSIEFVEYVMLCLLSSSFQDLRIQSSNTGKMVVRSKVMDLLLNK